MAARMAVQLPSLEAERKANNSGRHHQLWRWVLHFKAFQLRDYGFTPQEVLTITPRRNANAFFVALFCCIISPDDLETIPSQEFGLLSLFECT
jgi:hypothetical protein